MTTGRGATGSGASSRTGRTDPSAAGTAARGVRSSRLSPLRPTRNLRRTATTRASPRGIAENPEDAAVSARRRVDETKPDTSSDGSSSRPRPPGSLEANRKPSGTPFSVHRPRGTPRTPRGQRRRRTRTRRWTPWPPRAPRAAESPRLDADAHGERSEYATLARIALATHKSGLGPRAARSRRGRDARERARAAHVPVRLGKRPCPDVAAHAARPCRARGGAGGGDLRDDRGGAPPASWRGWMFRAELTSDARAGSPRSL